MGFVLTRFSNITGNPTRKSKSVTAEKKKEYNQRYYQKNHDKIRAQQKENYQKNREEMLSKQKIRSKRYYEKNRERILETVRYKYANNINGVYDRKSLLARERWRKTREELFEVLGGAFCAVCGFNDLRALEIDHVNGEGTKHRKTLKSHAQFVEYVKSHLNEFQVLCSNHHAIKTFDNNEVRSRNVVI